MAKPQNTERADPLAAAGLLPKKSTEAGAGAQASAPVPAQPEQPLPVSVIKEQRVTAPEQHKDEDEKATEKVTAYFTPPQYDHIDELRRQYRKRTKQRISVNALLRRLVERANLEDILP